MDRPNATPAPPAPTPLYEDPLTPFGPLDTAGSLVRWPLALFQMVGWLGAFTLMDRLLLPGRKIDGLARLACRLGTRSVGIRVGIHGTDRFEPGQNYLIAFNHVSLLDTPVLVQSVPVYARTFQDRAHFRIPLYGRLVRVLGQVPVEKGNHRLNEAAHQEALDMLRRGHSFAVFPEGHRSRDGRLGMFYLGAFRLAIEAGVPVLPGVSRGLRNLCPAKEWRFRGGDVDVVYGAPIPTEALTLDDAGTLAARTRAAMNELLLRGPG